MRPNEGVRGESMTQMGLCQSEIAAASAINLRLIHGDILELDQLPTVKPVSVRYAFAKRALDIIVSLIFLALAFIPMAILFLLVKLTSKGPALYKSERIGLGGKPFMFLKFRSMRVDADERLAELLEHNEKDGPIFKIGNDPRITPIGRFVRKYSLDELPQMIHVLTGHMTLVGPRPPLRREVMSYDETAMERLSVTPGITCYWQIMGRSDLSFQQWIELDRKYVEDMSFGTDLRILLKTPRAVLSGKGAY